MNSPFTLYTIVVLVAAALAAIAIWAPRSLPLKISALVLAAALMATGYVGFMEIIGRPKPVSAEWALETIEDAAVVATRLREGEGIYLWLEGRGAQEPRAYVLAWDLGDAKQLQQAMRQAEEQGTVVRMRTMRETRRESDEPLFYVRSRNPPHRRRRPRSSRPKIQFLQANLCLRRRAW
jgi:hypothetical protein